MSRKGVSLLKLMLKGDRLTLLCLFLVLLNILQYTRYEPITCQNIQLSNNLRGEIKEREAPQTSYHQHSNDLLNFSKEIQENLDDSELSDESNASESIDDSKKDNEDPDSSDENKVFWEDSKEDGSLIAIQSIFDSLEELKMPSRHIPIQHSVLVVVNSPSTNHVTLHEVASDVRMMHRQMARLAMKIHPHLKVNVEFYGNYIDKSEKVFGDFRFTSHMPLAPLQNAYKGNWSSYSAIVWIANGLNIFDIKTLLDGIENVTKSPPGTLLCGVGILGGSCIADAMMFTPATAKIIYMRAANHPTPMKKVTQHYMLPSSISGSYSLSGFLKSDSHSFQIRFKKKMNLSWLKISKAYQVFTAHPTKRSLPGYLRETQALSNQKNLKFINPPKCPKDGFVSFIKSGRTGTFRRDEIRKYYQESLKKQYQDSYNLFFLLGLPSSKEEQWLTVKVIAEMEKHKDIILYNYEDNYENLPMKTFAGYQFFNDHCQKKKYAIFHDDDIYVKLNELKGQLKKLDPAVPEIKCLKGKCIPEAPAMYFGKYYTWIDLYPPMFFIPTYSNGQATALTAAAAKKIYKVAKETDYREFRIEDMLYTGILRVKAGISKISGLVLPNGGSVSSHHQGMPDTSTYFRKLTNLYKDNKLSFRAMP